MHLNNRSKILSFINAKRYLLLTQTKILTKDEIKHANKTYLRWEYIKASKSRTK
jgi:hypothetical protein